jgi:SAM-dependent methyltransferase
LISHLSNWQGNQLLDVGAGGGEFLYLADRVGFNVLGIEPNEGYSEFARESYGVRVETSMLDYVDEASTDLVTLFHVLEHMSDPTAAIQRIWRVLRPGGSLFVEVPNILQCDASPSNIYFKAHLHYFSRHTLQAISSRFFQTKIITDTGNLRALLARRDEPLGYPELPSELDRVHTNKRLASKGWIEYLTIGGGAVKSFRKLRNMLLERRLTGSPKDLLNTIFDDRVPRI